ncbi:hypothetical protein DOTSEDRAFT_80142 [Dothistroma septosporum NZE10]|uniref:SET domain-containing protein n=1 Tax=Dothistroma septosporum (strain NZE10 / CBS 128990) TaxID=675120 RepID=N1PM11_DOTSN|nr:hypothetical protein DOTSEDRAFT_80142 [Dothistroma septosporum NZE10]
MLEVFEMSLGNGVITHQAMATHWQLRETRWWCVTIVAPPGTLYAKTTRWLAPRSSILRQRTQHHTNSKPPLSKDNGVFAARAIEPGTIIKEDKVATVIEIAAPTIQPTDFVNAISTLSTADQARLFAIHEGSRPYSSQASRIYEAKAFASEGEGRLYLAISLFNHSCVPNAEISDRDKATKADHVIAVKPIAKGEEILIIYTGQSATLVRQHLQTIPRIYHGFVCESPRPADWRYFEALRRLTPEQAESPRVLSGIPRFPLLCPSSVQQKPVNNILLSHLLIAEGLTAFNVAMTFSNAAEGLAHQMDELVEQHMLVLPTSPRLATL